MSTDIKTFKTLIDDDDGYGLISADEISSFTFSGRLNDYWSLGVIYN